MNRDGFRLQFLGMGSAGQAAARELCARKQHLIESLRASMNDIVALTNREIEAAIVNDEDLMQAIKNHLEKARKHKDSLLMEYQGHINSHGC